MSDARPRAALAISLAAAATAVLTLLALAIDVREGGDVTLAGPAELWRALAGQGSLERDILLGFRAPRVLAALIIGGGLAGAGCAFQAVLRNPLAEPYTLGVSSGSSLAAVIAIRFGFDQTFLGTSGVGIAALLGAAGTVYLVWRLGRVGASLPPATLLLAGITIAMFCSAATLLVQYTADFSEVYRIVRWMMGGLDGIVLGDVALGAAAIGVGLVVLIYLGRDFNAMSAGADAAASVGVDAHRVTAVAFAVASLVVGAGIALAGPIGFIGLMVPHALRAVVGPDHRVLVPCSILAGAGALVLCDTAARLALYPAQLPVGVVTALLGGPFFLYLLLREKDSGRLWG